MMPNLEKMKNSCKLAELVQFLFALWKFKDVLKIFCFKLNVALTLSIFKFEGLVFANIPNFIVEKDSEINLGCYRG